MLNGLVWISRLIALRCWGLGSLEGELNRAVRPRASHRKAAILPSARTEQIAEDGRLALSGRRWQT
jgi:hypothetical protein